MKSGRGLDPEEVRLAAALRRHWPSEGPSAGLDLAIVEQAAPAGRPARRMRTRLPWLLATAATAVLAVGTVLRLTAPVAESEPAERQVPVETGQPARPGEPAAAPLPAATPAEPPPRAGQAPGAAPLSAPSVPPAPAAPPALPAPARPLPDPDSTATLRVEEPVAAARAADAASPPAAATPASPEVAESQRRRAGYERSSARTPSEPSSVPDLPDAEAELLAALALLDAGQRAEAAAATLELRRRWPGLTLPDRLQALLPAD